MMDIHELAAKCGEQINRGSRDILLELPRTPAKRHRYMCGKNSPKGEIVADTRHGRTLVAFNAIDVLAWCCANGVDYEIIK